MLPDNLQPDQQPERWNDYVFTYETVFEPLTDRFARAALEALALPLGSRVLDVAAGTGGAALMAARSGADVLAIDAAPGMVARIKARAAGLGLRLRAAAMDARALNLADASFDVALSIFGVILCPDPVGALREIARILAPGGRVALVTWTEPERYELASRLMAAIARVRGPQSSPTSLPAQLRFRAEADFRALFLQAGLEVERIAKIETTLDAPSARWLGEKLAFAPGMAATLAGLGAQKDAVIERFVADLESDQGGGPIALTAAAMLGIGRG